MSTNDGSLRNPGEVPSQYSLVQVLAIWLAATLPMGILMWVVLQIMEPSTEPAFNLLRAGLLTGGLIWLFVLSMIIVYLEEGDLRLSTIRRRLWLNKPKDPETGETRSKLWLWLIPLFVGAAVLAFGVGPLISGLEPSKYSLDEFVGKPEVKAYIEGNWWVLGLFAALATFNTFLGEEFLFRGILLPKMNGVFGKWDWVANGILFGLYHVHQPWGIPTSIVAGFLFAWPSRRFRSIWMGIITHSWQSVFIVLLTLGLVLGLAD